MKELFMLNKKHLYNLRHLPQFKVLSANAVYHGTRNISLLGHTIREDSFQ